jgi:hypothetical protein
MYPGDILAHLPELVGPGQLAGTALHTQVESLAQQVLQLELELTD